MAESLRERALAAKEVARAEAASHHDDLSRQMLAEKRQALPELLASILGITDPVLEEDGYELSYEVEGIAFYAEKGEADEYVLTAFIESPSDGLGVEETIKSLADLGYLIEEAAAKEAVA